MSEPELVEIVTERMPLVEVYPDVAKAIGAADDAEFVRKYYVGKAPDLQEGERALVAYVSTEDIDRDREVIKTSGIDLKHYRKNAVVQWAHDHDIPAIGKAEWIKRGTKGTTPALIAKVVFAETAFADEIYTLYKGGFLKAFSIGFIVTEYREPKTNEFGEDTDNVRGVISKCQLLEFSCCNVPANQQALVAAIAKSAIILSDDTRKQLGLVEDDDPEEIIPEEFSLTELMEATLDEMHAAIGAMLALAGDFRKVYLPETKALPMVEIVGPVEEKQAGPTDEEIAVIVEQELGKAMDVVEERVAKMLTRITGRVTPIE